MTRDDESTIVSRWQKWRVGKRISNDTYLEFFETKVQSDPAFAHIHVFDVLDLLVNADCYARDRAAKQSRVA